MGKEKLIKQLDKWIRSCEAQADLFSQRGMVISEASSLAMKLAYSNVKSFIQENESKTNE